MVGAMDATKGAEAMPDTTSKTYRCPDCRSLVDPICDGEWLVSYCCDGIVERVFMCETCSEREAYTGSDDCFTCNVDSIIADPRYLEMCAPALQLEIGKALAERAKPTYSVGCLTRRQAS